MQIFLLFSFETPKMDFTLALSLSLCIRKSRTLRGWGLFAQMVSVTVGLVLSILLYGSYSSVVLKMVFL